MLRGKYVLGNLLGTPPPPPPPNVPALKTESKQNGKALSMREAMVQHRANPSCANCHARMDPIGFALDNFDAVGTLADDRRVAARRSMPSGVLPDGSKFEGVVGLRQNLLDHPQQFVSHDDREAAHLFAGPHASSTTTRPVVRADRARRGARATTGSRR